MQAARLSGARFSVLGGDIARLERALVQFFLDRHSEENGYTEMAVPYIVGRSVLEGTGQLPKFEDDLFKVNHQVNGEDGFLIPTAEVPLTNLFRESILDFGALPLSVTALTPCFRAEAGSYVGVRSITPAHPPSFVLSYKCDFFGWLVWFGLLLPLLSFASPLLDLL